MDPETIVYLIRDRTGRIIVLTSREEAEEFVIPEAPVPGIEERPFGWVLEHHPRALVRVFYQYYWAEELAWVAG
ncbi:MAG: hypothetical protein FJZ90_18695 [Chloroflexi bacterium]|nr:hypothetical protein [Chloroflexota bacterium]